MVHALKGTAGASGLANVARSLRKDRIASSETQNGSPNIPNNMFRVILPYCSKCQSNIGASIMLQKARNGYF